jgi:hypothetical protein
LTLDQTHDFAEQWRRLRSLLTQSTASALPPEIRDELDALRDELLWSLFSGPPTFDERRADLAPDDPRLTVALDILAALAVAEPDDSSYSWERGGLLFTVGRQLEAADDYLAAAARFAREAEAGTGATGDETDWQEAALYHAAKNLVLGGQALAAATLLAKLSDEFRGEIAQLIESASAPVAG